MPAHVSCLKKLQLMLDITCSHNHEHADLLETTTIDHHKEFVALYPACVKLKPHYQLHVVAAVRLHKQMMTCFGPERKSKFTKGIASHCYNKTTYTIASYELRRLLKAIQDPLAYSAERLRGYLAPCPVEMEATLPAAWAVREVKLGKQMVTSKGSFSKGDVVVWFQQGSDHLRAGLVQCLFCAEGVHGPHHVACINMYHHRDGLHVEQS